METQTIVLLLVFGSAAAASMVLLGWLMGRPLDARLGQAVGHTLDGAGEVWNRRIIAALAPASKFALPSEGWENSVIRQRFIMAGLRGKQAALVFFAAKTLLTFLMPAAYIAYSGVGGVPTSVNTSLLIIIALAGVGYYAPNITTMCFHSTCCVDNNSMT